MGILLANTCGSALAVAVYPPVLLRGRGLLDLGWACGTSISPEMCSANSTYSRVARSVDIHGTPSGVMREVGTGDVAARRASVELVLRASERAPSLLQASSVIAQSQCCSVV